jgi:heat shock protein HslJ
MVSRVWQAGVLVAVLGFAGCSSGGGTMPTIPMPTASSGPGSLVGPDWSLTTIAGKAVIEGTKLTASFSGEQLVSGSAGCNRYFGRAQVEAGRLSVGPLGSTMMACGQDGVMEQETLFLASLQAATSYTIQGDELRLGPSASQVTLVFAAH